MRADAGYFSGMDPRRPSATCFAIPIWPRRCGFIAAGGAPAYYKGPIAQAILNTWALERNHGRADWSPFRARSGWSRSPPNTEVGKSTSCLPTDKGVAALGDAQHHGGVPAYPSTGRNRAQPCMPNRGAQKLAYADLIRFIADPRFAKAPGGWSAFKDYAKERSALIDPDAARCRLLRSPPGSAGDTIYLTVVDRDGNFASLIPSLYLSFGSGG